MKKNILLFLCFLLSFNFQAQTFWANNTTSNTTNEAIDIEVDNSGNQYVAGYISGGTNFGNAIATVTSTGNTDIYVSKYSSSGVLIWVKRFGGSFSDKPTDLALDANGNIVVVGQYFGQATFGTTVLTSVSNSKDIFVLKLDNLGNVIWAISQGGAGSENSYGITTDSQNNVIITGQFEGASNIAGVILTSTTDPSTNTPNFDMFVSKYSSTGIAIWVKTGQAKYEERGLAVSCDPQNNIFLTGQFSDTLVFSGTTINNAAFNLGFLSKLSPSGTFLWLNKLKAGTSLPYDLEVNSTGQVYVTGDFLGTLYYETSIGNLAITNSYSKKIFVLKTNNNGLPIWHRSFGSDSDLSSRSISIDTAGNTYITGYFKCNWAQFHSLGGPTFNSVGFKDAYLLKLDTLGELDFVKQFGGKQNDEGQGVAILNNQTAVIAGSYTDNLIIPTSPTNTYTTTWSTYGLNAAFLNFVFLNGDNSPNSFVLNAINASTPDYNFFNNQPVDSLHGNIMPNQDTIDFCTSTMLSYVSNTNQFFGPNYNYLWNTGSTFDTSYISSSGTYQVYVERQDGCSQGGDTIVGIHHNPPPLPLLTDDKGIAINSSNYPNYLFCSPDSVEINFSNLCLDCDITIGNPSTLYSDTLPHLYDQEGTYWITVSDSFCSSLNTFTIDLEFPEIYDTIQPYLSFPQDYNHNDTITLCNDQKIQIHIYDYLTNPTGILDSFNNQPAYGTSIIISNNAIPEILTPFKYASTAPVSGWYLFNYQVILGYNNTCGLDTMYFYATDSIYVVLNTFSIHGNDYLCPGGSVYISVDTSILNFTWFGPGIDWVSANNDSIQVSAAGFYNFTGVLTDTLNGCAGALSVPFNLIELIPPSIVMNPADGIVCPGDSVTLTVPNTYVSYEWINPDGFIISTNNSVQDADEGFYYCLATDTNACILTTLPAEIIEFATPFLYADPRNVICDNENILITVNYSGNASISWVNPIFGGNQTSILTNQPDVYICEIMQCGYLFTDSLEIIDGSFSVSLSVDDSILCSTELATLSTNTGYSNYDWSNGNSGNSSITTNNGNDYSVIVTNQYNCIAHSDTITVINVPLSSSPNISDTAVCSGANILLSDGLGNQLDWFGANLNLLVSDTSISFLNLQLDTTIIVAYSNIGCPVIYDTVNVTVIPNLNTFEIFGDSQNCLNQLSQFSLSNPVPNITWYVNGNPISNNATINITASSAIQLISAYFANACYSDSASQLFYAFTPSILSLTIDSLLACGNTPNTLEVTGNFDSILWITNIGTFTNSLLNVNSTFGSGNIYVHAIDSNSCPTNMDSMWVTASPMNFVVTTSSFNCFGDSVLLTFNSSQDSLLWSSPIFTTYDNSQYVLIDNSTVGLLTITATDTLGCMSTDTIDLTILPSSSIILPNDTLLCLNSWFNYTNSNSNTTYTWQGLQPGDSLPVYGNDWYVLVAANPAGCLITDSIYIETVNCLNSLPNVFSPNGDGVNDFYYIDEALLFPKNEIIIVNRWGNIVYSEKGYKNTWNGIDLLDGVYFVTFVYDYTNPNSFKANTFIHIFR